jgi:hypothetical protein
MDRLRKLIYECKPEFVGKLAVYARTKMYMRSVPWYWLPNWLICTRATIWSPGLPMA